MRGYVLMAICFLCFGCGGLRKNAKTNERADITENVAAQIETLHSEQENTLLKVDSSENEEVTTKIVEFDTSQPIDQTTGMPPVARVIEQVKRKITAVETEQTAQKQNETEVSANIELDKRTKQTVKQVEQERKGMSPLQSGLCGIGIITIIAIIIWLVLKRFKP